MRIIDRKFLNTTTKTCHASTVVFDQVSNKPVFAWFGGSREGEQDSSIYVQYNGIIRTIGRTKAIAHWNPVLFSIENRVYLSFKIGIYCDRWQSYVVDLTEALKSFESLINLDHLELQTIPAGLNFCVKTKPIVKPTGLIYCGSSVETIFDWVSYTEIYQFVNGQFVYADRSRPLTVEKQTYRATTIFGATIKKETLGIIQPALWEDDKGIMHAFFRSSRGLGKIYHSFGGGRDWTLPHPTSLPNPNASIDVIFLDKRLFLVHNPSEKYRFPLAISELDENFEVKDQLIISEEPSEDCFSAEFSYPFMVEQNGVLNLTYTFERTKIEHVQIEV